MMGKPNASQQRGLTLVESMIALAITAVTVGTIAPSLGKLQDRRRLEAATAQLETELQHARSLAVARNESVRFSFQADATNSCYLNLPMAKARGF
jgi:type IV fimbrial biogenesis protein FimT